MLLGSDGLERLKASRILVFGLGGVGGYVVEALARSGVGALDLVDHDRISLTNLNRQILATDSSVGSLKTSVARRRIQEINPACSVTELPVFYLPDTGDCIDFRLYDYVIDAVDTLTAKLLIVEQARTAGVPVISAMGTGNRLDPTQLRVGDLYETSGCPLARAMRRECRKRGIPELRVVWSLEEPIRPLNCGEETERRALPGSAIFVPAAAGLLMASEAVRDIVKKR